MEQALERQVHLHGQGDDYSFRTSSFGSGLVNALYRYGDSWVGRYLTSMGIKSVITIRSLIGCVYCSLIAPLSTCLQHDPMRLESKPAPFRTCMYSSLTYPRVSTRICSSPVPTHQQQHPNPSPHPLPISKPPSLNYPPTTSQTSPRQPHTPSNTS